jgi:hypothetical protein
MIARADSPCSSRKQATKPRRGALSATPRRGAHSARALLTMTTKQGSPSLLQCVQRAAWAPLQVPTHVITQRLGSTVAVFGLLRETLDTDGFQFARYARLQMGGRRWFVVHCFLKCFGRGFLPNWRSAGQQLVENGAQGIHVAGKTGVSLAGRLLRRCVGGDTHKAGGPASGRPPSMPAGIRRASVGLQV